MHTGYSSPGPIDPRQVAFDKALATLKSGDADTTICPSSTFTRWAPAESMADVDTGGALRVGPRSAGAEPGPVCYGAGTELTVTDANLLLGRLDPEYVSGRPDGARLDAGTARGRAIGADAGCRRRRPRRGHGASGQRQHGACDPRGLGGARTRPARVRVARIRRCRWHARVRDRRHPRHDDRHRARATPVCSRRHTRRGRHEGLLADGSVCRNRRIDRASHRDHHPPRCAGRRGPCGGRLHPGPAHGIRDTRARPSTPRP